MTSPFDGVRSGIANAKRNLGELEAKITGFVNSNPYAGFVQYSADGREEFHKIRLAQPMPDLLGDITFDVASNLRAALDRIGFECAVAANPNSGSHAHFPFGDDLAQAQGKAGPKGRSRDIPRPIFDLMIACKPYRRGNGLLWALNKICNTNKHEIVYPAVMTVGGMRASNAHGDPTSVIFNNLLTNRWPPTWDSTKNEMTIAHVLRGDDSNMNVELTMFIAISDIEVICDKPVVPVLHEMTQMVEGIASTIKAEASRIGLFK